MHATEDQLVRRALGEPLPDVDAHVVGCGRCAVELADLGATVAAARAEGAAVLPPAPPAVWERVSAELGLREPRVAARARSAGARWVLAGAAALVTGLALAAVVADGGATGQRLVPVAGPAPVTASASGTVRLAADDRDLVVETSGLPDPDGYYEVWLLDPASGRMVALGALREDGTAQLPLPEGVALDDYPSVDVSVEPDDGDPAHSGTSALRAPVPS